MLLGAPQCRMNLSSAACIHVLFNKTWSPLNTNDNRPKVGPIVGSIAEEISARYNYIVYSVLGRRFLFTTRCKQWLNYMHSSSIDLNNNIELDQHLLSNYVSLYGNNYIRPVNVVLGLSVGIVLAMAWIKTPEYKSSAGQVKWAGNQ